MASPSGRVLVHHQERWRRTPAAESARDNPRGRGSPARVTRYATRRPGVLRYVLDGSLGTLLTAPLIYSLLVPLALVHVWVWVYERICFPVYGVPRVPHGAYFRLDRGLLPYLNAVEKVNCTFCSYGNGVIAYVREVSARTEEYWCPIKHAARAAGAHGRYRQFVDYGDGGAYRAYLRRWRQEHQTRRHS